MALTPKQKRFVEEYLIDLNATQAAIRAEYSEKTAYSVGHEILKKPEVQQAIQEAIAKRSQRTEITADKVLDRYWAMANADTNDLVEHRRLCCRYCWGEGNKYQRTRGEMERDRIAWINDKAENKPDFDTQGGLGYDKRKAPNSECQECFGDGVGEVFVKDTRTATSQAKTIYAGAKHTKEGVEVKIHSQADALLQVAKHLGMFTEKVEVVEKTKLVVTEEIVDANHSQDDQAPQGPGGVPEQ